VWTVVSPTEMLASEREHNHDRRSERRLRAWLTLPVICAVVVLVLCAPVVEARRVGQDSMRVRKSGGSRSGSTPKSSSSPLPSPVVLAEITSAITATDSSTSQSSASTSATTDGTTHSNSGSDSTAGSEHRHRRHHRRRRHHRSRHHSQHRDREAADSASSEEMRFHSVATAVVTSEAQKMAQSQSQTMGQTEALTQAQTQTAASGVVVQNPSIASHKVALSKIAFGFIIGSVAIFGVFMGWLIQWACSKGSKSSTNDFGRPYIPPDDGI